MTSRTSGGQERIHVLKINWLIDQEVITNVPRIVLLLCLGLSITTSTALAGECNPVFANLGPVVSYYDAPDCPAQDWDYDACVLSPINGTLNGDNWLYFYGFNAVVVLDPQEGHPGFLAGWTFSTMVTNKGELWTRDSWIIDFEVFVTSGFEFQTQTSEIIGGTGVYEGATGHLGYIGGETEGGILRGEVCTQ